MSQIAMLPEGAAGRSFAQNVPSRFHRGIRFVLPCLIGLAAIAGSASVGNAQESDVPDDATIEYEPSSGQFIVDYAMQFLGYGYVSGGNGPGGFDCSGFTQFVILNMLGVDIGHDVAGQINSGYWVDWGNWQPGDLVFFAGTYRAGISHVGIYIGDGQFIHAENENTGVRISSVYSNYYSGHYYGALRLI